MINIYAFCDNNCKHLVYTREEVLSLLQQAINDGTLKNIDADYAAVKSVVDSNAGSDITFWTGTEAEFNALDPAPKVNHFIPRRGEDGKIYICIDDTSISNLPTTPYSADEIKAMCDGTYKAGKGNFVNNVGVAALWDKANDSFSVDRVGDIKTTLRPTLGDKWALCNGAVLDPEAYPKLAEMLPAPTSLKGMQQSNIPASYVGADYANGICVAFGSRINTNGISRWIGTLDGMDKYDLPTGNGASYSVVRYDPDSGIWCIAYHDSSNGATSLATTDPVNGTWTKKTFTATGGFKNMHSGNGLWVSAGSTSSRNSSYQVTSATYINVTSDPINGAWSASKQIGSRGAGNGDDVHVLYHNGIWAIATAYEESRSAGGGYGVVVYTTDDPVNGTWTMQTILTGSSCYVKGFAAHDGNWVLLVYNGYDSYAYTTKNPAGAWESAKHTCKYNSTEYNFYADIKCLKWHCGKWYTMGSLTNADKKLFLFSAENPAGEWSATQITSDAEGRSICTDGKVLIEMHTTSSQNFANYLAYHLPTITNDGAYTYIRAKE